MSCAKICPFDGDNLRLVALDDAVDRVRDRAQPEVRRQIALSVRATPTYLRRARRDCHRPTTPGRASRPGSMPMTRIRREPPYRRTWRIRSSPLRDGRSPRRCATSHADDRALGAVAGARDHPDALTHRLDSRSADEHGMERDRPHHDIQVFLVESTWRPATCAAQPCRAHRKNAGPPSSRIDEASMIMPAHVPYTGMPEAMRSLSVSKSPKDRRIGPWSTHRPG